MDSAEGYSSSVLCTSSPADQYGQAVVFQNNETGLRTGEAEVSSFFANIKAGFLLPGEIREFVILVPDPKQPVGFNTVGGKESIGQTEGRHRYPSDL